MTSQIGLFIGMLGLAYLIGSIPTAYLAGKWLKGIDLREYGSGTVSASMVWEHVEKWALFPVGIFDILKGAIPIWIALALQLTEQQIALIGMAAVLGHNWSVFLNFHGGRCLSPFLGVLFVLYPYGFLGMLLVLGLGVLLDISAPLSLVAIVLLPGLAALTDGPAVVSLLSICMFVITFMKRLEANHRPLPPDAHERFKVIMLRIFFDRDLLDHKTWLQQKPSPSPGDEGNIKKES